MIKAAILLALALAVTLPSKAHAALTRAILLACKEEADLRQAAKLRSGGGDKKAAAEFEAGKKASGGCMEIPRNTVVQIDERKPPLTCVRLQGGLDCFWVVGNGLDEFLNAPVAPREAPAKNPRGR